MIKKIFQSLLILAGAFLIYVLMQPSVFKVSRSIDIAAPIDTIFAQVNDQKNINSWSPWMKFDPNVKISYEGPTAGVGAKSFWEGNKDLGSGSSVIVESRPNEYVEMDLHFIRPAESKSKANFTLTQNGEVVNVSWNMEGKNTFLGKVASAIFDMDEMIGGTFENGLKTLKELLEAKK